MSANGTLAPALPCYSVAGDTLEPDGAVFYRRLSLSGPAFSLPGQPLFPPHAPLMVHAAP
ncbi:hypothetical protein AtDm6_3533 [Acetobacter tropicalis]|uniref:Uncharacterized protein n=1 Tax=Acetobacter tropicalis TaxID=104102 RepID=A0A094YJJ1_9PROT|nr:hypothetical protein AtDm6_3533 [Acetobacter tropicalis]